MNLDKILDVIVGVMLISAVGIGAFVSLANFSGIDVLMSSTTFKAIVSIGFIVFFVYWVKGNLMKKSK
jgi:hypothetical protein